jgi:hypothetical protein
MDSDETDARLRILQRLEDGEITAAQALSQLQAEAGDTALAEPPAQPAGVLAAAPGGRSMPTSGVSADELAHWRRWWAAPFALGLTLAAAGGLLVTWAFSASALALVCAALPLALGLLVAALALASRSARWVHLRVRTGQAEWPRNITLSFPLPLRFTAWVLRTFGPRIPELKQHGVDELILALAENATPETPLYLDVNQDGGEHVQVYIG